MREEIHKRQLLIDGSKANNEQENIKMRKEWKILKE
jgi:hypothetical protein